MNRTLTTLQKISVTIATLLIGLTVSQAASAEVLTVGSCDTCDYTTIQTAVDAAENGDYIDLQAGTYTEDIIVAKEVVIVGNIQDYSDVVIKGKITVTKLGDLEIQYLTLNAEGKNYGIKVRGIADVKYGIYKRATIANILVEKTGELGTYEADIKKSKRHGILAKNKGKLGLEKTTIRNNRKAGVKTSSKRKLRMGNDSVVANNKVGINAKYHYNTNSNIVSTLIRDNKVGAVLTSTTYNGATFEDNGTDLVEL